MKKLLPLLLLLSGFANADIYAQWGVASQHPAGAKNLSDIKFIESGAFGKLGGKAAYSLGLGGWTDKSNYVHGDIKARNALYALAMIGVEPQSEHMYMSYKIGPAVISRTDALLGSNIQIAQEIGIGMKDDSGVRVGIVVKHFSNAGLTDINEGRNFLGIQVGF